MIARELKAALPLVVTLSAVLFIGVVFFSFSKADAAFVAPTNEPDTNTTSIATTNAKDIYNIAEPQERTITEPITATIEPTNSYTTILAIALVVVTVAGIGLIIAISRTQHGRRR